jgi:maltose alpha-D-glucosyltransferase/alpha-amylase
MLFDFILNSILMFALASEDAQPIVNVLREGPRLPEFAQWTTFLRNHDENDLSRLTPAQMQTVFAAFAPDESMLLYNRGIRRRMAPMLGNDRRRLEMTYALQFSVRGTPMLRYGEEIGMGDDLTLPGRQAIRTPMQWSAEPNAGFSTAPPDRLVRRVISGGEYGYERVNVTDQRQDPGSLLSWFERMIHTLRECPESGSGSCEPVDEGVPRHVLAHVSELHDRAVLFLHNLRDEAVTLDLPKLSRDDNEPISMFSDRDYQPPAVDLRGLELAGYGYRWIRLH